MIPINPWEHQNAIKTLYSKCVGLSVKVSGICRCEILGKAGLYKKTAYRKLFCIYDIDTGD